MKSYPLRLLSECLNCCTDKNKFNRYFNEYYEELSPPLLRSIQSRLRMHGFRGDLEATTKELWGNIFFEHYQSIFMKRPQAAQRILELSGSLKFSSRGELFSRQINTWKNEIVNRTYNMTSFLSNLNFSENDAYDLEQQAQKSNRTLLSYKTQGYELLAGILSHGSANPEEVFVDEGVFLEADSDATNSDSAENVDKQESQDSHNKALKSRIAELRKMIEAEGEAAADAVVGCEGGARFSLAVAEILDQLSRILIPVMPTLYWLMGKRVSDHMRKAAKDPIDNRGDQTSSDINDEENPDEKILTERKDEDRAAEFSKKLLKLDYQKLLEGQDAQNILRRPDITEEERKPAQKELDRCKKNSKLNLEILELKLEEYSQEEIALDVGLTRDQVRGRLKEIRQLLEPLEKLLRRPEDQENI
ncbi:hypothetical protein [Nitrosomonas ureae]|uniref:Uncharacterized protein n=1 Tax=Nitrosomonas ureae TaxID=44577 RepID=A0A1H9FH50_9PROT|nr:hypothetical protein [Nitrosomonas ureae]SEQ37250.1 hypothetical protein SAMN05421510_104314 [Nitrosomonas ureae]